MTRNILSVRELRMRILDTSQQWAFHSSGRCMLFRQLEHGMLRRHLPISIYVDVPSSVDTMQPNPISSSLSRKRKYNIYANSPFCNANAAMPLSAPLFLLPFHFLVRARALVCVCVNSCHILYLEWLRCWRWLAQMHWIEIKLQKIGRRSKIEMRIFIYWKIEIFFSIDKNIPSNLCCNRWIMNWKEKPISDRMRNWIWKLHPNSRSGGESNMKEMRD